MPLFIRTYIHRQMSENDVNIYRYSNIGCIAIVQTGGNNQTKEIVECI